MSEVDLDAIERRANKQRATDEDLIDMVAEVRRLRIVVDAALALADKYANYEVTVIGGRGFAPSYSGQVVAHDIRRALTAADPAEETP